MDTPGNKLLNEVVTQPDTDVHLFSRNDEAPYARCGADTTTKGVLSVSVVTRVTCIPCLQTLIVRQGMQLDRARKHHREAHAADCHAMTFDGEAVG